MIHSTAINQYNHWTTLFWSIRENSITKSNYQIEIPGFQRRIWTLYGQCSSNVSPTLCGVSQIRNNSFPSSIIASVLHTVHRSWLTWHTGTCVDRWHTREVWRHTSRSSGCIRSERECTMIDLDLRLQCNDTTEAERQCSSSWVDPRTAGVILTYSLPCTFHRIA